MIESPLKRHFIGNLYRVVGDPFYMDQKTTDSVRNVLSDIYIERTLRSRRVRVWYGNVETGRAWNDTFNVSGYVGRNMDRYPRPMVLQFKSSLDGEVLVTNKIVRIDIVETGETVYSHERFHVVAFSSLANINESVLVCKARELVRHCMFKLSAVLAR